MARRKGKKIHIKKSKRGSLRKSTGTKKGKKIPVKELQKKKRSKNPRTRKKATFALNARKWNKGKKK